MSNFSAESRSNAIGPGSGSLLNVQKVFEMGDGKQLVAVDNVSFSFKSGEIVSLLGPSGCGKTTVLKMVAGLIEPSRGTIEVSGSDVKGPYDDVGMVFQTPNLMPWRSVLSNITFPLEVLNKKSKDKKQKALTLLSLTGLEEFKEALPSELSGGMQQRTALCRALIHNPEILLMDEPFGALDELTRMEMNDLLLKIQYQEKNTILFVTHSISEAIYLSDTVYIFSTRPAKIEAKISVKMPHPRRPDDRYSKKFQQFERAAGEVLGVTK